MCLQEACKTDVTWDFCSDIHNGLQVDGLVQERRNSSALPMELRLSCINPVMCSSR